MITSSYIQWTECNGIPRGEIIHEYEPLPSKYCVFTGHRKCSPKYAEDHIRTLLTEVIRNHEPDVFMIGMGPGADLLAAKILSEWNIGGKPSYRLKVIILSGLCVRNRY